MRTLLLGQAGQEWRVEETPEEVAASLKVTQGSELIHFTVRSAQGPAVDLYVRNREIAGFQG